MQQSIGDFVLEIRKEIPDLIGGVHLVNGGRQLEYKLEKPKESFKYRVRLKIGPRGLTKKLLNELFEVIRKGLEIYKNHVTVPRFRTLYEYECAMPPTNITFTQTHRSYSSRFRDGHGAKKYRLFSINKYGPELAYKLAKLNSFLVNNGDHVGGYEVRYPQYIKRYPCCLTIEVKIPEISFCYISYVSTNVKSIDAWVHDALADMVCDYALAMARNVHTVEGPRIL
jgi:hypothetical protein